MTSILIKQRNRMFRLNTPRSLRLAYVADKGLGVLANRPFKKGETVIRFKANLVPHSKASREAVTVDNKLALDTRWLVTEAFVNHSCSPNTRLDLARFRYVAIRSIRKNEEITYNYLTSECDMKAHGDGFRCFCGSPRCVGFVGGFRYLSRERQIALKPLLTPFLQRYLESRRHSDKAA